MYLSLKKKFLCGVCVSCSTVFENAFEKASPRFFIFCFLCLAVFENFLCGNFIAYFGFMVGSVWIAFSVGGGE